MPCLPLMCEVVAAWQTVDTKMHGCLKSPPTKTAIDVTIWPSETMKEKVLRVELSKAKPGYSDGCVKTFEDFKTGLVGMTEDELRPWFARIKLRYSCSSIAVAFVRIVVPELIQRGVTHLLINKSPVELSTLKIYVVHFVPRQRHMVEYSLLDSMIDNLHSRTRRSRQEILKTMSPEMRSRFTTSVKEIVEGSAVACSHNVLLASSGEILDFSGGQFTGTMLPMAYGDAATFKASLPGDVVAFQACSEIEIEEQLNRDRHTATTHKPYEPHNWGSRVASNVCSLTFGTSFCCVCLGTPKPAEILKRCMRCKAVLYCGKACQRYDWGRHKAECKA